jgi:hypothetical protein
MYLLALFIVELQTAKRRLITIFEDPHDTSKETLPLLRETGNIPERADV